MFLFLKFAHPGSDYVAGKDASKSPPVLLSHLLTATAPPCHAPLAGQLFDDDTLYYPTIIDYIIQQSLTNLYNYYGLYYTTIMDYMAPLSYTI